MSWLVEDVRRLFWLRGRRERRKSERVRSDSWGQKRPKYETERGPSLGVGFNKPSRLQEANHPSDNGGTECEMSPMDTIEKIHGTI